MVDAYAVARLAISYALVDHLVAMPNQSQRLNRKQKDKDVPKAGFEKQS